MPVDQGGEELRVGDRVLVEFEIGRFVEGAGDYDLQMQAVGGPAGTFHPMLFCAAAMSRSIMGKNSSPFESSRT